MRLAARLRIAIKPKTKQSEKTNSMKNEFFDFMRCLYKNDSEMPVGIPRAFSLDLKTTDVGG